MLKNHREGRLKLDRPWKDTVGRKPLLTIDELQNLAEKQKESSAAKTMGRPWLRSILKKAKNAKIAAQGNVPLDDESVDNNVNKNTLRNYEATLANLPGISVKRSVTRKNETREISENSIRRVSAFRCRG